MLALCFQRLCVFGPDTYASFRTKMFVCLAYTSKLLRMRCIIQAHASNLWCFCFFNRWKRCVSNVYVCSDRTHTLVFGQRCLFVLRIHHNWYACVFIFRLIRRIYDVGVSFANVCVVFLTYMCVRTQHIRRFSYVHAIIPNVYIIISTQALL
jgi:hypothetical protein